MVLLVVFAAFWEAAFDFPALPCASMLPQNNWLSVLPRYTFHVFGTSHVGSTAFSRCDESNSSSDSERYPKMKTSFLQCNRHKNGCARFLV